MQFGNKLGTSYVEMGSKFALTPGEIFDTPHYLFFILITGEGKLWVGHDQRGVRNLSKQITNTITNDN